MILNRLFFSPAETVKPKLTVKKQDNKEENTPFALH